MRRSCPAIVRTTSGAMFEAASGEVNGHTKNTAPTPSNAAARVDASDRSPPINSTLSGRPAEAGSRSSARSVIPVSTSCETTWRPTVPVAPVIRIVDCSVIDATLGVQAHL